MEKSPAQKPVTQRDIAQHCGLKQSAVSFALRGDTRHVTPETIERVQAAAVALGYNPEANQWARKMIHRRFERRTVNHLIAVVLLKNFHASHYMMEPFLGVCDTITEADFDLMTVIVTGSDPQAITTSHAFARGDIDGVISIIGKEDFAAALPVLRRHSPFAKQPVIQLLCNSPDVPSVDIDHEMGGYLAARHLFSLGHQHILALMALYSEDTVSQRLAGIYRACNEFRFDPAQHVQLLKLSYGWIDPNTRTETLTPLTAMDLTGQYTIAGYLDRHAEVTGILAWNDACAINVYQHLMAAGYQVPRDISLVGFDDLQPIEDAAGRNILTTIHAPLREAGKIAADLLIRRILDDTGDVSCRLLPVSLVERASTAPSPGQRVAT